MLKIIVESSNARKIEGNKNGKDYAFQIQEVYVQTFNRDTEKPNKYPEKIEITLEKDQAPYAVGEYILSPLSLWIDRNRRLVVSPKLMPVTKTA